MVAINAAQPPTTPPAIAAIGEEEPLTEESVVVFAGGVLDVLDVKASVADESDTANDELGAPLSEATILLDAVEEVAVGGLIVIC